MNKLKKNLLYLILNKLELPDVYSYMLSTSKTATLGQTDDFFRQRALHEYSELAFKKPDNQSWVAWYRRLDMSGQLICNDEVIADNVCVVDTDKHTSELIIYIDIFGDLFISGDIGEASGLGQYVAKVNNTQNLDVTSRQTKYKLASNVKDVKMFVRNLMILTNAGILFTLGFDFNGTNFKSQLQFHADNVDKIGGIWNRGRELLYYITVTGDLYVFFRGLLYNPSQYPDELVATSVKDARTYFEMNNMQLVLHTYYINFHNELYHINSTMSEATHLLELVKSFDIGYSIPVFAYIDVNGTLYHYQNNKSTVLEPENVKYKKVICTATEIYAIDLKNNLWVLNDKVMTKIKSNVLAAAGNYGTTLCYIKSNKNI